MATNEFDRIINLTHEVTTAAGLIACVNREKVEQFYSYEDKNLLTQAVVDVSAIKADLATVCKAHGVSSQPLLAWIRDAMEAATESSPVPDAPGAAMAVLDELKAAAALAEDEAATPRAAVNKARRGRMKKDESEPRRMAMLAKLTKYPTMKYDIHALADETGVSDRQTRRWVNEWEQRELTRANEQRQKEE